MYIRQLEELSGIVHTRLAQRKEITRRTDDWIKKSYGIEDFLGVTKRFFGPSMPDTALVLCRQIPSIRMEDIACTIGSQSIGYPLVPLSFIDDSFSCANHEKKSYAHPIWIGKGGNTGKLFREGQRLVSGGLADYISRPLSLMPTLPNIPGNVLPDFHFRLRNTVFGPTDRRMDISELHRTYTRLAHPKPLTVYDFSQGVARKAEINPSILESSMFRPAAEWYYPLYFSWFLDGSMVLLETYDNDLAEVSLAKTLFEATMSEVERNTGFQPLVLKIPPLDERMLMLPKSLVKSPGLIDDIGSRFSGRNTGDSVSFFSEIADSVLEF